MSINELIVELRAVKNKHFAAMRAEQKALIAQCSAPKLEITKALFEAVVDEGEKLGFDLDPDK